MLPSSQDEVTGIQSVDFKQSFFVSILRPFTSELGQIFVRRGNSQRDGDLVNLSALGKQQKLYNCEGMNTSGTMADNVWRFIVAAWEVVLRVLNTRQVRENRCARTLVVYVITSRKEAVDRVLSSGLIFCTAPR